MTAAREVSQELGSAVLSATSGGDDPLWLAASDVENAAHRLAASTRLMQRILDGEFDDDAHSELSVLVSLFDQHVVHLTRISDAAYAARAAVKAARSVQ